MKDRHLKSMTLVVFCASLWLAACSPNPDPARTVDDAPQAEDAAEATDVPQSDASNADQPTSDQVMDDGSELYQTLLDTEIPAFDVIDAAISIGQVDRDSLPPLPTAPINDYAVGDNEDFWLTHIFEGRTYEVTATLAYVSEHTYFWVHDEVDAVNQRGQPMSDDDWVAAGDAFDAAYERVRDVFGEESSPGIDGDSRMHILHSDIEHMGRIFGYFSGADGLPTAIYPQSNEKDMFFVAIDRMGGIGGPGYIGTLAHEYQHAIQQNVDPSETLWLNEAMSKVAEVVGSGGTDDRVDTFTDDMDQSLWYWGNTVGDYFHGYFLLDFLSTRAGDEFIPTLAQNPRRGIDSIEVVLDELGVDESFDELFGDFMAAMFIDGEAIFHDDRNPDLDSEAYAFNLVHPGRVPISEEFARPDSFDLLDYERQVDGQVNQYGIDAVRITGPGYVRIRLVGESTVAIVPLDAASGEWMWWSNREDNMFTALTRAIDLTNVDEAVLTYQAWYETDTHFDYGYVLVSTDGGDHWTPQESTSSTQDNPQHLNLGYGLTGTSGVDGGAWVEERVDLSAYAGQEILLRFAMTTDAGVSEAGLLIDDVGIESIGWFDDLETDDGSWMAEGFVRINNVIPQKWIVRAVSFYDDIDEPYVSDLNYLISHPESYYGAYFGEDDELLILISGATRYTTQQAGYQLSITIDEDVPEE